MSQKTLIKIIFNNFLLLFYYNLKKNYTWGD